MEKLEKYGLVDEDHGLLTINKIKDIIEIVFENYDVEYCYLFGSYAKGLATESSDIDLVIETSLTGIKFFGLIEELREQLKKRVEVITVSSLEKNVDLIGEILRDGIKVYGKQKE